MRHLNKCACLGIVAMMMSVLFIGAMPNSSDLQDTTAKGRPSIQLADVQDEHPNTFRTIGITIHRLLEDDPIDFLGEPDWYYAVGVSEDGVNWIGEYSDIPIVDEDPDVTVDAVHHFSCESDSIEFFIALIDYDSTSADDVADISSYPGGGGSRSGPLTDPSSYPRGAIYMATFYPTSGMILGDDRDVDGPWYKVKGSADGSTSWDEDDAILWFDIEEVVTYPIEVRIHKIRALDSISGTGTGADWYYIIGASTDGSNWENQYSPIPIANDKNTLIVDASHRFYMDSAQIYVAIALFDDDVFNDDLADISGYPGGGMDDFPGGTIPRGAYFMTIFDWNTDTLDPSYDEYVADSNWYYKTSGEFDGSTEVDENDAEVWFRVFSLPPKVLDHGPKGGSVNDASTIGIIFSARMDEATVESAFSIAPTVQGEFRWNNDSTSFFFVPSSPLPCSGSFSVSLTTEAADVNGFHIETPLSWTFTVENNDPPIAVAGEDQTTELFKIVTFDARDSYDLTGEIVSYEWDFGDGSTGLGLRTDHAYFRAKDYQITLTVEDNYGLSATDTFTTHVEKGNYMPQNLNYDYAHYWDYFNVNFTTTLGMSLSTGFDQLVDLSMLGISDVRAVESEVLANDYEYVANLTGLTDDDGRSWNYVNLKTTVEKRSYLRTLSGFPMRQDWNVVQEFSGEMSDATRIEDHREIYRIELTEPISVKLSEIPQSATEMDLWHLTILKVSRYFVEDGDVIVDAEGSTHLFPPFQRKHIFQPLGTQDMDIGGEIVRAYGLKETYEYWNPYEITYTKSLFSPHYDIVNYGDISLDEGWLEYTCWYADMQQTVPLKEIDFTMEDDAGSPDYSTRMFLLMLELSSFRERITLTDGDNEDQFSTDYETTVRVYEPWAHAQIKLGGNSTHEVFLNFDLVYDVIVRHQGYVVFNHNVAGEELDRTISSELVSSYDEFQLMLEPHFDLSMESINIQTGEVFEEYFYLELPVPTLEDVDGDGSHVNLFGYTIYMWDNPALIWSGTGEDLAGRTQTLSSLSVTLAKIDLLALIEMISNFLCPPCAIALEAARWFVGLYLNFNLNVNAEFYYLVGTYSETNGTFDSGEEADLQFFGFESPAGEDARATGEMTVNAGLGETVGTRMYRFVKSHVEATVLGSINFETVLFPGTIFETQLFDIPIIEGEQLEGSAEAYSFTGTYLYHEFTGSDETPPVSEVLDLPEYTTARSFDVHANATDELSGVKNISLYFRVDSGPWTEYGVSANGHFLFGAPTDGYHEFYSIATDNWGNVEDPPATADAYTYVDTLPPNLVAPPNVDNTEDSTLEWQGEDETTGIDHYEVSVDGGAYENVGMNTSYQIGSLPEGTHITIRAYDKAGNFEEKTVRIGPEPAFLGVQNEVWLLILAIAAVIAVLAAIVVYRRRSERD